MVLLWLYMLMVIIDNLKNKLQGHMRCMHKCTHRIRLVLLLRCSAAAVAMLLTCLSYIPWKLHFVFNFSPAILALLHSTLGVRLLST